MSITALIGNDISLVFPTPLMRRQLVDMAPFDDDLRTLALEMEERASTVRKSNVGGYQSEPDLFINLETGNRPSVMALRERVMRALHDMTAVLCGGDLTGVTFDDPPACWINVNANGDYNLLHHHLPSTWSGCYYVDAGEVVPDRPFNGHFEIRDPRVLCEAPSVDLLGHREVMTTIVPVTGTLLVFPGYAAHMVHPYFGTRKRVSIAFNCGVRRRTS